MAVDLELAPGSVLRLSLQSEFAQDQVALTDVAVQPDDRLSKVSDLLAHVGPGCNLAIYRGDGWVSEITVLWLLFTGDAREGFLFHGLLVSLK